MDLGELQKHIHMFRKEGLSDEAIRERLTKAGWDSEHINTTLAISHSASEEGKRFSVPILFFALLILGGLVYWQHVSSTYNIQLFGDTNIPGSIQYGAWSALAQPDYYQSVKKALISEKTPFIVADLSQMQLTVYENGTSTLQVPIKAKGKKGSWWETPVGLYKIQSREENHFSSFGKVYQPYSLAFQGNFFIHGWPYYPDGTPVATSYSGGCIRLSNEDAEKVFSIARVGMPVLVYEKANDTTDTSFSIHEPLINADSYIVADVPSGTSFFVKDAEKEVDMGSLADLLLALVTVEHLNIEKHVTVPESALVETDHPRLHADTDYSVLDLLTLILREESHEAVAALISEMGKGQTERWIAEKEKALGMKHTTVKWSGDELVGKTTPADLFLLAKHITENRSFLWKLAIGKASYSAYDAPSFVNLRTPRTADIEGIQGSFASTSFSGGDGSLIGVVGVPYGSTTRPTAFIFLSSQDAHADLQNALSEVRTFSIQSK